jgi:hypothetical protein
MIRVPSELWVKVLLRRCSSAGVPAVVVRRGDEDAGAVFIKVGLAGSNAPKPMAPHLDADGVPETDADVYLARQREFDPDIWLVEIDDREGRTFVED